MPDYECKDGDNLFYLTSSQVKKNSSRACEMVKSCKNLEAHNSWVSIYQEFMVSLKLLVIPLLMKAFSLVGL